jgi:Protein of unknown function (DUF2786)/SprT-like family
MLRQAARMDHPALTVALERALVRELLGAWRQLNDAYFKGALLAPALALVTSRTRLAQWVPSTRTIEVARELVLEQPWASVVEVLKHEMAHQYVHEVLGERGETAHGKAFRDTCARLGIDARASGVPAVADEREAKVVERIARLLALAESPNRHEAEAAATQAQRLMLKYNLEEPPGEAAARDYGHKHLGTPTGRVTEAERIVAMVLGKYFFVEVIWVPVYRPLEGKRGSVLEVCGTRANLAMAEYVHAFLTQTADRLWAEHKRETLSRSNRDRRTFLAGVMAGFADKLARQSAGHKKEGLVWVKDGDLQGFFRRRHPYIRHVRHAGERRTEAFARGREAGQKIVLHRAVESPATSRGRLLPP